MSDFATSLWPSLTASRRGVPPHCDNYGQTTFELLARCQVRCLGGTRAMIKPAIIVPDRVSCPHSPLGEGRSAGRLPCAGIAERTRFGVALDNHQKTDGCGSSPPGSLQSIALMSQPQSRSSVRRSVSPCRASSHSSPDA
eukprot:4630269-Prymnesium_polylepis.1